MQKLTEIILKKHPARVLADYEVAILLSGNADRRYGLVKRALAAGELIQVRRGLYAVSPILSGQPVDLFELAGRIYGPSYVSLESALAFHGLIPEAVHSVTSITLKRSLEFKTPLGVFSYVRIPSFGLFSGVERKSSSGGISFIAEPLKALADYAFVHKKKWMSFRDAVEDLRLDEGELGAWTVAQVDELLPFYGSRWVRNFLKQVRRGLVP